MQWEVAGVDRNSGVDKTIILDANDEPQAIRRGNRAGLMVSAARPLDAGDSVAGSPSAIGAVARAPVAQYRSAPVVAAPQHLTVQHQIPSQINVKMKGTSGLGVAALVIGIIAVVSSWVPFLGLVAVPLGMLGILLGGIGFFISLVGKNSGVGLPVAGIVACLVAISVAISVTGATAKAVGDSMNKAAADSGRTNQISAAGPSTSISPPAAVSQEKIWDDGFAGVAQGDVAVKVVDAKVGKVGLDAIDGDSVSVSDLLMVTLVITNKSGARKLNYESWAGSDVSFSRRDYASLEDEAGNIYKRASFPLGTKVKGQQRAASVYPGESTTDVLVFERPTSGSKELRLELPGENIGGSGMIRLLIQKAKVTR
jgi:molybdopterin/thiamine biosynthesis adenylyltransferase